MAEKVERLTYKIQFDAESGTSTIRGLDGQIKATMVSTQKLRQEYGNFATQIKATNAEINNLSGGVNGKGGLNGMSAASGSASAAALELGRVVSDAPYGIRGMANNVSQLASQLFFMASQQEIATVATKSDTVVKTTNTTATVAATTATVGFAGALRMMWTALMGPLGILLALQAVIAAADYFFGGMKKAADSTKKLDDGLAKMNSTIAISTAELDVYAKVYKEATVGTQKHTNALKELRTLGFDPATKSIDDFIIKQKELIVLQATSGIYKKQLEDLISAKTKADALILKANTDMALAAERLAAAKESINATGPDEQKANTFYVMQSAMAQSDYADALERTTVLTKQRGDIWLNIDEKAEQYKLTLEEIMALMFAPVKGGGADKRIKEFKQNLLDLSSELASFRDKEMQNADISEEERLRLEYEASRKAVENKRLEYKDKEDARLDAKLKEVNDSKATEDEKARLIEDAYQKYNEAQIQANEDLRSVMLQADTAYYSELAALRKKDTEAAKEESKDLIAALTENNFDYQEFNETQKINAAKNDLNRIREELEGSQLLTDLKVSGLEKELLAEEGNVVKQQEIRNKIAKLNQDQTLYEEDLDRKKAIAKVAIAMQVSDTIAAIAGEGSGIAKGVAVAQTIWNTKQAFMAALGSAPYGPWNIAQATAVGVMGIKNVNDILATKAPNEKASDVSAKNAAMSGGGGGSAFNPNFNIVGASGSNQLAETVAGQIGEPTRAYVVYDDIATAGEIEANAIEASGI